MIKLTIFALAIIFFIVKAILNNKKLKNSDALLANGNKEEAFVNLREMFINSFSYCIDSEGNGHVPSFLAALKKQKTSTLDRLQRILEQEGQMLDIAAYDELIIDVQNFMNEKGVMDYKKVTKPAGKTKYKEYYKRLVSFIETIPATV